MLRRLALAGVISHTAVQVVSIIPIIALAGLRAGAVR